MSDFVILQRYKEGSSIKQICCSYASKNKCTQKQAREVVEVVIYNSQKPKKVI